MCKLHAAMQFQMYLFEGKNSLCRKIVKNWVQLEFNILNQINEMQKDSCHVFSHMRI